MILKQATLSLVVLAMLLAAANLFGGAPKTLGKSQAIGVVADAFSVLEHHRVHRADAAGFRR